ncbi:MAG: hypothetical protein Q7S04_04525 [Candidatus Moranbacteria bacterium]|nr:hypothetical protein [Candidatus Moranbacteria bacterium]
MASEPSAASKAASQARRRAMGKARRAVRKAVPKTKFTGEKPSFMLYGGATIIALFKDLLDFVGIGSLPAIGTVVTICFSLLIFILLTVFDNSGGWNKTNRVIMRGLVFTLVAIFEGIFFGLNFLPLETFTVIGLYLFARHTWKEEDIKAKEENRLSAQQTREEQIQEGRYARIEEERRQEEMAREQAMTGGNS